MRAFASRYRLLTPPVIATRTLWTLVPLATDWLHPRGVQMPEGPLKEALDKITPGDVAVEAPEWSNRDGRTLVARLCVSVLLFGLVVAVLWNVRDPLPGEQRQDDVLAAFNARAVEATTATAAALQARRSASALLRQSRAELIAIRKDPSSTTADRREARQQRDSDLRVAQDRRRVYRQRLAERSSALKDVLEVQPSSDVDSVRAIGVGALALIALIGAGALLAPRPQTLSVRRVLAPPPPAPAVGQPTQAGTAGAGGPAPGATGAGGSPSGGSVSKSEPALVQGVIAAFALAAGLFGIQETEGTTEILLNIALPLVPIVGALFTRARVAPRPNLSPEERLRLFGG